MKYTEFEGIVCHLGKEYDVNQNDKYIYVVYAGNEILEVSTQNTFRLVSYDELKNCPKKQEVWNAGSFLAATPLDERFEHKYNVIIGEDRTSFPYTVWAKNGVKACLLATVGFKDLQEDDDYQFTDSEFKDLIKYIKTLPNGEFQAKVAEHGKQLVKGDK